MVDMSSVDQLLCFSLYSASRATTRRYHQLLAPWGLTYPQYLVLVVLWDRGTVTVRELGQELALDSGTLSPLLKRLEAADLIRRTRSAEDERRVDVSLTEKGGAAQRELAQIPEQIGTCMGLDQDSFEELLAALKVVNAALNAPPTRSADAPERAS
jgi:DNA-binding MarR family transcriptional regulator